MLVWMVLWKRNSIILGRHNHNCCEIFRVAVVFPPTEVMAGHSPGLGDLESSFVREADSALSSYGYFLSLPARETLAELVIVAVQHMRAGGVPRLEDIERARLSLSTLVDRISHKAKVRQERRAKDARDRGFLTESIEKVNTIDVDIVRAALQSLCPGLWPFC